MKAIIYSDKDIIGTTNLKVGDFTMGGLYGEFFPNEIYFNKIQKYVWKFWSSKKINYKEWSSLNFNIQLENGMFILPIGGITFDDVKELKDEPKRIDLFGVNTKIIEDYILINSPRIFTEKPWESISIKEKIEYQTQLLKDINIPKSIFDILKPKKEKHLLFEATISAFCKNAVTDEILFEIESKTIEQRFILKSLKSNDTIELFTDFNEFKHFRMFSDKAEWED